MSKAHTSLIAMRSASSARLCFRKVFRVARRTRRTCARSNRCPSQCSQKLIAFLASAGSRSDLPQRLTSQPGRPHGEPSSVVIGEAEAPPLQLASKDAILFQEIAERLPLPALQPAGEDDEQHLERRGVNHGRSLYHDP
jgi:hypothetical protein